MNTRIYRVVLKAMILLVGIHFAVGLARSIKPVWWSIPENG
jgi:hypothetical protein